MNNESQIIHYKNKLKYEVDAWDLHEAIKLGENIIVIDARAVAAYQNEHIPGAINFPHQTMNSESVKAQLVAEEITYIVYCDGIGCNASTKGALKLAQLGYKVKELIGGIDWWKRDGYATVSGKKSEQLIDCGCG